MIQNQNRNQNPDLNFPAALDLSEVLFETEDERVLRSQAAFRDYAIYDLGCALDEDTLTLTVPTRDAAMKLVEWMTVNIIDVPAMRH